MTIYFHLKQTNKQSFNHYQEQLVQCFIKDDKKRRWYGLSVAQKPLSVQNIDADKNSSHKQVLLNSVNIKDVKMQAKPVDWLQ
jgi:hypothetical protein